MKFLALKEVVSNLRMKESGEPSARTKELQSINNHFENAYANKIIPWKICLLENKENTAQTPACIQIQILNDDCLKASDLPKISHCFLDNKPFVTFLLQLNFQTLIISGKESYLKLEYSLKEIAELHHNQ